ncbi:MFS transporter [Edwardsiella anguillarum]|nr:MFS transporter [Edwardsiella anguillarum]
MFLGCSAALWGSWLEKAGPRKVGVVAACCWCGGLMFSALGVYLHQLWMLWLGSGVIGGIGLGLGYISPVSTLIRWFPDRRGMATGLAIMGFGGGAMVGAPLANSLMHFYAAAGGVGVWQTFLTLALIYWVFMLSGALAYRIPPIGWRPRGWRRRRRRPRRRASPTWRCTSAWPAARRSFGWCGRCCVSTSPPVSALSAWPPAAAGGLCRAIAGRHADLCRAVQRPTGADRRHRRRVHRPAEPV